MCQELVHDRRIMIIYVGEYRIWLKLFLQSRVSDREMQLNYHVDYDRRRHRYQLIIESEWALRRSLSVFNRKETFFRHFLRYYGTLNTFENESETGFFYELNKLADGENIYER